MNRVLVALAVIVSVTGAGIVYGPVPWFPPLVAAAALIAAAAWKSKRQGVKVILANAAAVCVALAAFEGYLGYRDSVGDGTVMEGSITEGFTHADDVLGYAPDKGSRVTARKRYGDSILYDVVYTIGPDGRRVAPPAKATGTVACVVFFGDSVTFGEGVNDEQAYPYRVGRLTGGNLAVRNSAFSGYGAHQMLSALQPGLLEPDPRCQSVQFIYLAIPEHIARVAGLTSWDTHGPRFRQDATQRAVRDGNFDDPHRLLGWAVPRWLGEAFASFHTWERFLGHAREPGDRDLALFVAVVRESAKAARERVPGSGFQVLLWDARNDSRIGVLETQLEAAGIPVYRVTQAIPDLMSHQDRYVISEHDPHPNPLQHELIAEYVVRTMLVPGSRH